MTLTIETIVEKYCSIGNDEILARYLQKQGFTGTDAELKEAVEEHRELHTEKFRQRLQAKGRIDQIYSYLMLFSSFERVQALLEATYSEPADVFWPVFINSWQVCDGTRAWRKVLIDVLVHRRSQQPAWQFLPDGDRAFLDTLSWPLTVYRGCGRRHIRGISWTTDRIKAEYFARGGRLGRQHDPVIATAQVKKAGVFFVLQGRRESEIVLDPYAVRLHKPEAVTT